MNINSLKTIAPWDWPPSARTIITSTLQDKSLPTDDRTLAATFAGDLAVMNEDVAQLLLSLLTNPAEDTAVRAISAIALGPAIDIAYLNDFDDLDDPPPISQPTFQRALRTLRAIHDDASVPTEVRRRALEAAVRAPEDWHPPAIDAAYQSSDEQWKLTAVFCMRYVSGFSAEILASLNSSNNEILAEAVHSAGENEIHEAWPRIYAFLSNPRTGRDVLLAAISAAGSLGDPEAIDRLEELQESPDEEIAEAASDALYDFAGPDDLDDADDAVDDEPPSRNGHR